MDHWRNKWALVTGASAGIGKELAILLGAGGAHLVLTARRADRLESLAKDISGKHGVRVEVFPADLARPEVPGEIFAFTARKKIDIELLVNNAGFGAYGFIYQIPLSRQLKMVQVNCAAVVHLTHLYLPAMVERGCGDILIVASTAGFQAVPFISTYAATKAFDLLFAEGLAEEVACFGIRVCALCPGSTTTEFQKVARQPDRLIGRAETAEKVARVGLEALAAGKSSVISGRLNWVQTQAQRLAPRRLVVRTAAKLFAPPTDP